MTLSVLMITNNEHRQVLRFVLAAHHLATALGAELVLGLDREKAQQAEWRKLANQALDLTADRLQEDVMDQAVEACRGEWILRLDDDELASPALESWLHYRRYEAVDAQVYAFPRVYLWGDEHHILSNEGIYPDLQTRLGKKECMYGVNHVHAGNRCGTGMIIPYAIEHHNLLVKNYDERYAIAQRYESLRPGAGLSNTYARYLLPEDVYQTLATKPYTDGDYSQ